MMVNDGYIGISSGKLLQFAIENGHRNSWITQL